MYKRETGGTWMNWGAINDGPYRFLLVPGEGGIYEKGLEVHVTETFTIELSRERKWQPCSQ